MCAGGGAWRGPARAGGAAVVATECTRVSGVGNTCTDLVRFIIEPVCCGSTAAKCLSCGILLFTDLLFSPLP